MLITADSELFLAQCHRFSVDKNLVAALVTVESGWDHWAYRYEMNFVHTVDPEKFAKRLRVSRASELTFQKTSFGLMQIMGGTARDLGFKEQLPKLFLPECGLEWGIRYLITKLMRYNGDIEDTISAYNQGSARKDAFGNYLNQAYVNKVLNAFGRKGQTVA